MTTGTLGFALLPLRGDPYTALEPGTETRTFPVSRNRRSREPPLNLQDVQAVIASARARGMEPLHRFIRRGLPEASESQVRETASVALEVIESVPVLLARASQVAEERELAPLVQPILDQAETYFVQPVDLIPEMTQGLAGLLDDTYLVLRILANLQRGPDPLVDWDLEHPTALLRGLVGRRVGRQLDDISVQVMREFAGRTALLWERTAHQA